MTLRRTAAVLCAAAVFSTAAYSASSKKNPSPLGYALIANQIEHTAVIVNLSERRAVASIPVGVNGHETVVSPDGKTGYVPIYGNSGVGKPGTDGNTIAIIDLASRKLMGNITLDKAVRPHCAKFGPDGLLYVTAELDRSVYVIDTKTNKVIAAIPTGADESHMMVISPDGKRAYTANVGPGSVSVLDLQNRKLITVIPVSKMVQRISINHDGTRVYTHDQSQPRIAVIDTASNKVTGWIPLPTTVYSSVVLNEGHTMAAASPSGKLYSIDLDNLQQIGESDACKAVGEITTTSKQDRVYLSCPQTGEVQVFNPRNGKPDPTITLTRGVDGISLFEQ